MSDQPDLSKFPDLGFDPAEKLEQPPDPNAPLPKPLLPPGMDPPECTFCDKEAIYLLDEIHLVVRTSEGAEHVIATRLNPNRVVAACMEHKSGDKDEEIAEGAHLSVQHDTGVLSELVKFDVYWKMI